MKDIDLKQNVTEELDWEPSIDASDIGVGVEDGVVTLMGFVRSYAEKSKAENVVKRLKGVRAIAQELDVRYPGTVINSDDKIAQRAANILEWDVHVPSGSIQAKVQNGFVTLSGDVDWRYQSSRARKVVEGLDGVKGVSNLIKIKPTVSATNVKERIEKALVRNAETEAKNIKVSVSNNIVTLTGQVDAWHDREIAESAAWAAPGVTEVKDLLRIGV